MKIILKFGIGLVILMAYLFIEQPSSSPEIAYEPDRFTFKPLFNQLNEPIEFEIFNNGNILLIERRGDLKLYNEANKNIQPAGKMAVGYGTETGLLGLALDPNFSTTSWIYLFYTDPVSRSVHRVSRFDFQQNQLIDKSEKILLEIPFDTTTCCHHGGALEFGPDGNLFISTGDNTTPTNFAFDERPENRLYDAQRTSANTMDLRGKILRIKPTSEGSYSIPKGNLFSPDDPKARPEIYVMGARNPFRISVDQKNGWLFWGDVGPNPGRYDPRRGPNTHEEFNVATTAGNYGWPYLLGNNMAFSDFNFSTEKIGAAFDPLNLKNDSPNNSGKLNLPPAKPAIIWYPTEVSSTFPALGSGGGSAMTGPVFNYQTTPEKNSQFPKTLDKKLFIFDWMRSWIMAVDLDSTGQYLGMQEVFPHRPFVKPIQIKFGPQGAMYVLDYGSNWYTANADAGITKIIYHRGNRPPVAKISTEKYQQNTPFTFTASAQNSYDPDKKDKLQFEWKIDGETVGQEKNLFHTFKDAGTYQVTLKVVDPMGAYQQDSLTVFAGNDAPEINLATSPNHGFYQLGTELQYETNITDTEDEIIQKNQIKTQLTSLDKWASLPGKQEENIVKAIPIKQSFYPGEILINESDCRACHAQKTKSVGPSWTAISDRYSDQPDQHLSVARKIINGGEGVWGDKIMSAHPQFSEEEAMDMIRYILSFNALKNAGPDTLYLSDSGSLNFDDSQSKNGRFILQTTYTDMGANGVPPIQVVKTKILRPRLLGADQFDFYHHTSVVTDETSKVRKAVVSHNGGYIGFDKLNISDTEFLKIQLRTNATLIKVEVHVDHPSGPIMGKIQKKFPSNYAYLGMNELKWQDLQIPIWEDWEEPRNLYLVFYTNKDQSIRTFHSIAEVQKVFFSTTND